MFAIVEISFVRRFSISVDFSLQQVEHVNLNIVIVISGIVVSASNLFLYCYFGKMATESFEHIADALYECNWQKLPIELQKYFIIMMSNSQRSIYYSGYGIAVLNLETFTKVSNEII